MSDHNTTFTQLIQIISKSENGKKKNLGKWTDDGLKKKGNSLLDTWIVGNVDTF